MKALNKFAVCALVLGSVLATGCDPVKRSGGRDKSVPNAANPYQNRGGDEAPKKRETPSGLAAYDEADIVNFETKNSCAIDICGPLFPKAKPTQAQPELAQKIAARTQELKPLIESAVALDQEVSLLAIQKLDEIKPQLASLKLEDSYKAAINLFWMYSNMNIGYPLWNGTSFDEAALKASFADKKMSSADAENFIEMATYFFQSSEYRSSFAIETEGFDAFVTQMAKSEDLAVKKAAAKAWALEIQKKQQVLHAKFPLLFSDDSPAIEALVAGQDLDAYLVQKISSEVSESFLHSVMVKNVGTFVKRQFDFQEISAKYYNELRAKQLEEVSAHNSNARLNLALNYCGKTIYGLNALGQYEEAALANAPKFIEQVRESVSKVVDQLATDAAVIAEVKKKVSETRFSLPAKADVRMGLLVAGTKEEITGSKENLAIMKSGNVSELALMMSALVFNGSEASDPVARLCINHDPTVSSDYSKSGYGQIQLSWRTLLQTKTGYGVIAHEFGHEISAQLAKNGQAKAGLKYFETVACLTERKGSQEVPTSEEDFADIIAVKAIANLKAVQVEANNFACVLMDRDESRWGTDSGLALNWPAGKGNSHSTSFYRAIQYEVDAGHKLPASCESVVSQGKPSMAKTCL